MTGHPDHDPAHTVLADTVTEGPALGVARGIAGLAVKGRARVTGEVGASRHEPGHFSNDSVEA